MQTTPDCQKLWIYYPGKKKRTIVVMHPAISKNLEPHFAAMNRCTILKSRQAQIPFARSFAVEPSTVIPRCHKNLLYVSAGIMIRGGLHLPNFSENPNNVRKWVGGVNACSDWKCLTLDNFGQFSKVQWLSRSVLLEVKNLCLLSISRSFLLLEAHGRRGLCRFAAVSMNFQNLYDFAQIW